MKEMEKNFTLFVGGGGEGGDVVEGICLGKGEQNRSAIMGRKGSNTNVDDLKGGKGEWKKSGS